jgi:S-methylmethionine-dependent homocysteine/selenocysteine methylase
MSVNFFELFDLKEKFTKDELKKSFENKIKYINKLAISPIEKKFIINKYYFEYHKAKQYLYNLENLDNNIFNPIDLFNFSKLPKFDELENNKNINIQSKSYSYHSVTNLDGSKTVVELTNNYNNGKSNKYKNSYVIDSKGNKKLIN